MRFLLDLLRVALAWLVFIRLELTPVGAPRVWVASREAPQLQQGCELHTYLIPATSNDIRQDLAAWDGLPRSLCDIIGWVWA